MRAASSAVPAETMKLSRSPTSEVAAAAVDAKKRLDVGGAESAGVGFLVVAVEPGRLADARELVDTALRRAD